VPVQIVLARLLDQQSGDIGAPAAVPNEKDALDFCASWEVVMKLNVKAFALAFGLIWGLGLFLLTWWVIGFEGSTHEMTLIGHIYRGYNISPGGSVLGLIWGFADGFVGGAIFAWLYNAIAKNATSAERIEHQVEHSAVAAH
jgi:hypothetical protein